MNTKKRIVTMGGGTGQPTLLFGLKQIPDVDLTAIVSSSDSGGSSEKMRQDHRVLPPGDVVRCMLALADVDADVVKLFEFRPPEDEHTTMGGHRLGNLILTAATVQSNGDVLKGMRKVEKILNPRGRVFPITTEQVDLGARFENNVWVWREDLIDVGAHDGKGLITEVRLRRREVAGVEPRKGLLRPLKEALDAIRKADMIVAGPGDLFTSIIPNVLFEGTRRALKGRRGLLVFVTNVMTKRAETDGFTVRDFVSEFEKYAGVRVDAVLCNTEKPPPPILERYRQEGAAYVEPLLTPDCQWDGRRVVPFPLLAPGVLARHDSTKLAYAIRALL